MTDTCINAYHILHTDRLSWPVRRYDVRSNDGRTLTQDDRARMKDAAFALRTAHKGQCRGYGFVIDVDPQSLVLPAGWLIPPGAEHNGIVLASVSELTVRADNPAHDAIVSGILRELLKRHIKDNRSESLGVLWQDYGRFCQLPDWQHHEVVNHCRGFQVHAKRGAADRWMLSIAINTTAVDARSIADYFGRGDSGRLAELIRLKRDAHPTRGGASGAIRAFCHGHGLVEGQIVELDEPDVLIAYELLNSRDQRLLAGKALRCHAYARSPELIAPSALYLILDTQQTEELHAETILEPGERFEFAARVRQFLHGANLRGADLHGPTLELSDTPVDCSQGMLLIGPPDLFVKGPRRGEVLKCRQPITEDSIRHRSRERKDRVVKHGFLISRPMQPLLAVPERFAGNRTQRLLADCNDILRSHGVMNVAFVSTAYRDAAALRKAIEEGRYDAVLAVLPDARDRADETYEKIKRTIEVPSQCMQARNVIPASWAERPAHEFATKDARLARKLKNQLELTVINLLVKHNWVPYAPASPYHFNVQIGLDVGGIHSTNAVACVGYGFGRPDADIVFRLNELPIEGAKKEPIQVPALRSGLLEMLERIAETMEDAGQEFDATRLILYRDGRLLGRGDLWNERDALDQLLTDAQARGWIRGPAQWAALEISKDAEGLRVFDLLPQPSNPLVGRCVFPFNDRNTALVSSTGRPYLPQGTAMPLKVHLIEIAGSTRIEHALQDLVWQCDLGFSKPDMGFSLPWVLRVADVSALQLSRLYKISGIAA